LDESADIDHIVRICIARFTRHFKLTMPFMKEVEKDMLDLMDQNRTIRFDPEHFLDERILKYEIIKSMYAQLVVASNDIDIIKSYFEDLRYPHSFRYEPTLELDVYGVDGIAAKYLISKLYMFEGC